MAEDRVPPPLNEDIFGDEEDNDDIFGSKKPQIEVDLKEEEEIHSKDASAPRKSSTPNTGAESPNQGVVGDSARTGLTTDNKTKPGDENSKKEKHEDNHTNNGAFTASAPDVRPKLSSDPTRGSKVADAKQPSQYEEEVDKFNIEITVTNPMKKGDGMNAYMVYQVNTVTNNPAFKKSQFAVTRRFSDFLGLFEKLLAKHLQHGIVVPKAPEKNAMGMAKVKMSKEDSGSQEFIEKRRAALERYLNRTAAHPVLRMDPDFRDFLELDADLPKASNTSALSAGGVMRLFTKVGDAVTKLSSVIPDTDPWFEDKAVVIENLEIQLKKLHESSEFLVIRRQGLAQNAAQFAKACAIVASADEHSKLKQVMSKLSHTEEKIQQIYEEQADSDFFTLSELLKDYMMLISAVKDVFSERVKVFKHWKDCETTLAKKREAKVKLELANKTDKIPQAEAECKEWEEKVSIGERDFENISESLRKEMGRFDFKRVKDFKVNIINYMEKLMNNEEQLIKYWEEFLPEAKSIA